MPRRIHCQEHGSLERTAASTHKYECKGQLKYEAQTSTPEPEKPWQTQDPWLATLAKLFIDVNVCHATDVLHELVKEA